MTGSGFGMKEVGRIIHSNSNLDPAKDNKDILEKARQVGRRLAGQD